MSQVSQPHAMRLVENVHSSFMPMNCKQVTVRLFHVEQESLFLRIANMFSHKGRCQQFGGHWKTVLNEVFIFQKLFRLSLPGQRNRIVGIIIRILIRNTCLEYLALPLRSLVAASAKDNQRNTVCPIGVSQHECSLILSR